jgi:hypothetical protein
MTCKSAGTTVKRTKSTSACGARAAMTDSAAPRGTAELTCGRHATARLRRGSTALTTRVDAEGADEAAARAAAAEEAAAVAAAGDAEAVAGADKEAAVDAEAAAAAAVAAAAAAAAATPPVALVSSEPPAAAARIAATCVGIL